MEALEIAQAVYQNLRKPSQQKLPWQTLLRAMSDCQRRLLREAQLSDRGWMEKSGLVTPSTLDDELFLDGFSIPTRVEYHVGPSDDDWYPVSIVNHDGFSSISGDAVSFYGSPVRIAYAATNLTDLVGREYRVWYETAPSILSEIDQSIDIAPIFTDLLTDETVVYCIPLVQDDSETWRTWLKLQLAITADRLGESKRQWRKWLDMARQNGIVYADGFQGTYYTDIGAYLGPDGYPRST